MKAPVIAGLDGSAASPRCVAWAAAEASLRRRPLELVHATMLVYRDGSLSEAAHDALVAERTRLLTDARAYALALHPGLDVRIRLLAEEAGRALVAQSEHAELLVLGTGGQEGFGGLRLGSVLVRAMVWSRCPVLAVPDWAPEPDAAPAHVVVGIEEPQRERAVGWAFEEAHLRGARLTAVHTCGRSGAPDRGDAAAAPSRTPAQPPSESPSASPSESPSASPSESPSASPPESLDAWRTKYPEVQVTHTTVEGHPARALAAAGRQAAMVVVGAARRHGPDMAMGGLHHALLHQNTTAVVIVP